MSSKKLHIGTSGWSYKHWKGLFYPENLKLGEWFTFYSERFDTAEINSSFYRIPNPKMVEGWVAKAPKGFLFSVKLSRYITHMKKLRDPEEALERFFDVFAPLQKQMGPVLIQLPPMLKFHYDVAENFFTILRKHYTGYEYVLEIRHTSWLEEESLTLMAKYDVGLVISQSGNVFPYSEAVTAKNVYVRFHGPGNLYASQYSDEQLEDCASKFRKWIKEGHHVWAYFNNDVYGFAFQDAERLRTMLKDIYK